jgi:hypothetical protein
VAGVAIQWQGSAGNRLNTNQVESRSALVVESKDPARNAVIRKSYIKK